MRALAAAVVVCMYLAPAPCRAGDAPSPEKAPALEVKLDKAGRISVGGASLSTGDLRDRIRKAVSKAGRIAPKEEGPRVTEILVTDGGEEVLLVPSKLKAVIRAEEATPYSAVQLVMVLCMKSMVWDISLAVGEGEPVEVPLPRDAAFEATKAPKCPELNVRMKPGPEGEARCELSWRMMTAGLTLFADPFGAGGKPPEPKRKSPPMPLAEVGEAIRRRAPRATIDADGEVHAKAVVEVVRACTAAGIRNIRFAAPPARILRDLQ